MWKSIVILSFGTVACACLRQVRLASLAAAKHTPRKSEQRDDRKTKPKGAAEQSRPANPLGIDFRLPSPRSLFYYTLLWFLPQQYSIWNLLWRYRKSKLSVIRSYCPSEFTFSVGLWWHSSSRTSTVAKSLLKTLIWQDLSRVRIFLLSFFHDKNDLLPTYMQRFWLCSVDIRRPYFYCNRLLPSYAPPPVARKRQIQIQRC